MTITQDILDTLRPLIEADSQNPPRAITPDGALVTAIRSGLPGFEIAIRDLGEGCLIIDCTRGESPVLFNVHMDTVPVAPAWQRDPHKLTIEGDRAYGLGTCDTKGAAAVMFVLARAWSGPMRILLTTDEEAGQSRCVRTFVEDPIAASLAVVAEPTSATARLEHRGITSARLNFKGESGHASGGSSRSAVHDAARFVVEALADPEAESSRLNIGRLEGGLKPNMVAGEAEALFGFRAKPGQDSRPLLGRLEALAGPHAALHPRFEGPALPSDPDGRSAEAQRRAYDAMKSADVPIGDPVDFWTEASLFSEAGVPSVVLGAGDIAQAHTADEFVPLADLQTLYDQYMQILKIHG